MTAAQMDPRGHARVAGTTRTRHLLTKRRLVTGAVATAVLVAVVYLGYVGWAGSDMLLHPGMTQDCQTPAAFGWQYEAINYDVADDARLAAENSDMSRCSSQGAAAGTAVVTTDGIRVAGWYIPGAGGDPASGPTVVLVHGRGANKSEMLRYAATLHEQFNIVILDLRGGAGRTTGALNTVGALEYQDLRAMLDWLVATKHPRAIGVLGDSGGAATSAKLARTDTRIAALVLDSVHARFEWTLADAFPRYERLSGLGFPPQPFVWATYAGAWLRSGVTPRDADPLDAIPDLVGRRLMLVYGTADTDDVPAHSALVLYEAARQAGMNVEIHACDGATHGQVVNTCAAQYPGWVVPFFQRSLGA